jgi:dolichyl-phosphate beta-glucosyltransferase
LSAGLLRLYVRLLACPIDHSLMTQSAESPRRPEVIVVVPCYNEARRLAAQAFAAFLESAPNVAILFVDDGSTDDTPLVMERLRQAYARQVYTLRLSSNVGKAEAVRRGIQIAFRRRPTFVGYWDADLATPLEAITQLCDVLRAKPKVQLAMGSRVAMLGRDIQRSGARHLLGRAFATAASTLLGLPVYDTQCGAKLFRATPEIAAIFSDAFLSRWIFDVEILARMMRGLAGVHRHVQLTEMIYEFPLEQWRDVRGSRLAARDFARAAMELLAIYWEYVRGQAKPASVALGKISEATSAESQKAA